MAGKIKMVSAVPAAAKQLEGNIFFSALKLPCSFQGILQIALMSGTDIKTTEKDSPSGLTSINWFGFSVIGTSAAIISKEVTTCRVFPAEDSLKMIPIKMNMCQNKSFLTHTNIYI